MNIEDVPAVKISEFWGKVYKTDQCWYWVAAKHPRGYGIMSLNRRTWLAHRVSYIIAHGHIPDGLQIDHVCHSVDKSCVAGVECQHRLCVNPAHLEAVTSLENTSRGRKKDSALDECKHGHKYTPENTRTDRRDGARVCKTCNAEKLRRYVMRQRALAR